MHPADAPLDEPQLPLLATTWLGRYASLGPLAEVYAIAALALVSLAAMSLLWSEGGQLSDARADWLVGSAVTDGLDPFGDVVQLASIYEMDLLMAGEAELGPGLWIHPRTPGALLLLAAGSLLGVEEFHVAMLAASTIALIWIVAMLLPELSHIPRPALLAGAPLLVPSYPVFSNLEYGAQSAIVAGLVLLGWVGWIKNWQGVAGVAIGIAAALKLWPLLVFIAFWATGRRRAAIIGATTFGTTTAVGILVFNVTPQRVVTSLGMATDRWLEFSGNGSATGWIVRAGVPQATAVFAGLVVVAVLTWVVARRAPTSALPAAITLALLASPLSWEHYDIVLIGVAAWLITRSRWQKNIAVAWLLLAVTGMGIRVFQTDTFTPLGLRTLAGRLLLAIAVLVPIFIVKQAQPTRESAHAEVA